MKGEPASTRAGGEQGGHPGEGLPGGQSEALPQAGEDNVEAGPAAVLGHLQQGGEDLGAAVVAVVARVGPEQPPVASLDAGHSALPGRVGIVGSSMPSDVTPADI
jgi:hypothetical protein